MRSGKYFISWRNPSLDLIWAQNCWKSRKWCQFILNVASGDMCHRLALPSTIPYRILHMHDDWCIYFRPGKSRLLLVSSFTKRWDGPEEELFPWDTRPPLPLPLLPLPQLRRKGPSPLLIRNASVRELKSWAIVRSKNCSSSHIRVTARWLPVW